MLEKLKLINFRGFKEHELSLRKKTIIVGANNTGKSTIVEAIRLVSLVTNRYLSLTYSRAPQNIGVPLSLMVVSPSLNSISINFDNLFYNLGEPPSIVEATFSGGEEVEIYLTNTKNIYAEIRDSKGTNVRNRAEARHVKLPQIHILPQVGPLAQDEKILSREYVYSHVTTDRSYLHFRNQLRLMEDSYSQFCTLASLTWPGFKIRELVGKKGMPGDALGLLVQDGGFVAEASWMGHGLQVWLQAIWFMARTPTEATVVLDEPDVYLHPDLQRRLIKMVQSKYAQLIMSTHSIEIMSEVEPNEILVVDRRLANSRFADDQPSVQKLVDHIGSAHNVNLARITATKRFLITEGDDLDILGTLHKILFPYADYSLSGIPHLPLGGWGGWEYAIGSKLTLDNYVGDRVKIYCILDRDYHTKEQVAERYKEAIERGIELYIWSKKELENYLVIPSVIRRLITSRIRKGKKGPSIAKIENQLSVICEELKEETIDNLGNEFLACDRKGGFTSANIKAKRAVELAWTDLEHRLGIISGKVILSRLSGWSQESYGVSFGPIALARSMLSSEIAEEMAYVLEKIEKCKGISNKKK